MADLLVWSGAAGLATGATWDDAFLTREDAALAAVSGDRIIEATDHAQAEYAATTTIDLGSTSEPVETIRAARGAGANWTFAPASTSDTDGIVVATTNDLWLGNGAYTGVRIVTGDDLYRVSLTNLSLTKCIVSSTGAGGWADYRFGSNDNDTGLQSVGTTWQMAAGGGTLGLYGSPTFVGDTFTGQARDGSAVFIMPANKYGRSVFSACDLTGISTASTGEALFGACGGPNGAEMRSCGMPASYALYTSFAVDGSTISVYACTPSGASADCGYAIHIASKRGEVITDTGLYLTTGYVDDYDSTPLSHAMVPSSTDQPRPGTPLIGPWLYAEMTTTGVKNLAVELVENYNSVNGGAGNLSKDDIHLQVLYMGTLDVAAFDLHNDVEVIAATATPTALTAGAGTAAWTGVLPTSAVSSKLEATVTVGNIGLYAVRVVLGVAPARFAATAELFYDPSVTVT